MLTRYIHEAMRRARYKILDDGTCFGEVPGLPGVWANEPTTKACREVLQEVLEEWLVLKIRDNDPIPVSVELHYRAKPREQSRSRYRAEN